MKFVKVIQVGTILAAAFLTACSDDSEPKKQAPKAIEDSFQKSTQELSTDLNSAKQGVLTLKKASLGKAFLLSPSMLIASANPILDHLQPLVVSFEKSGEQLAMFELNTMSFYKDLASDKLLHSFKITSETADSISFNWEYGTEFISGKSLDFMTDYGGGMSDVTGAAEEVYPSEKTFVRQVKMENNTLQIEQVSRFRMSSLTIDIVAVLMGQPLGINASDLTITTYFRLSPYVENKEYKVKDSELDKGIGFFEQVSYDLQDQSEKVISKRWDLSKAKGPITYAITKNVPADMVDSVTAGVLYWNKVLGYEAIKVETGADPMELPRERRVLIHWIDWKNAGFARASMQADPLTGELLAGNVYMTSVFAVGGEQSARMESDLAGKSVSKLALGEFASKKTSKSSQKETKYARLSLKGFSDSTTCSLNPANQFHSGISQYKVDPVQAKKAAQDYVASTVAHEVGHTLGLRHNFVASLQGDIKDSKDLAAKTKEYLTTPGHKGVKGASSVMDYDGGMISSMVGAYIRDNSLPYDVAALKWGYTELDKKAQDLNAPLFCTDGHIDMVPAEARLVGCERFDATQNPIEVKISETEMSKKHIIQKFYNRLVQMLYPLNVKNKKSLREVVEAVNEIDLVERAQRVVGQMDGVKPSLLMGATHFQVQAVLGKPGFLNGEIFEQTNMEVMFDIYQSFGGLMGTINRALPLDAATGLLKKGWLLDQANTFLASPAAEAGTTWEGVDYKLTENEKNMLKSLTEAYAVNFEAPYTVLTLDMLTLDEDSKAMMATPLFGDGFDIEISEFVQKHLLAVKKDILPVVIGGKPVELPLSEYSSGVRRIMLRWMSPKRMGDRKWALATRTQLKAEMVKRLQILTGDTSESASEFKSAVKKLDLEDGPLAWANAEISVLGALEDLDDEL